MSVKDRIKHFEGLRDSLLSDHATYKAQIDNEIKKAQKDNNSHFINLLNQKYATYMEQFIEEANIIKAELDVLYVRVPQKKRYGNVIIANDKGEILLLKRSSSCSLKPNEWCVPGGHIEDGESNLAGSVRECKEETGLDIWEKVGNDEAVLEICDEEKDICYYKVFIPANEADVILDSNEHSNYVWADFHTWKNLPIIFDQKDHIAKILGYSYVPAVYQSYLEKINDALVTADSESIQKGLDNDFASNKAIDLKKGGYPIGTKKTYKDGSVYEKIADTGGKGDWVKIQNAGGAPIAAQPVVTQQVTPSPTAAVSSFIDSLKHTLNSGLLSQSQLEVLRDKLNKSKFHIQLPFDDLAAAITMIDAKIGDIKKDRLSRALGPDGFPKDLKYLKLVKNLGGSTGAELYEAPNGQKFVVKAGGATGQSENEGIANELYSLLGFNAPKSKMIGGKLVSTYLDKTESLDNYSTDSWAKDAVAKSFVVNALLANWDVVENGDNVRVDPKTKQVYFTDNGGALFFRAKGSDKGSAFGNNVDELLSMRSRSSSQQYYFGSLTDADIVGQIDDILKQKDTVLGELSVKLKNSGYSRASELYTKMSARFDSLESYAKKYHNKLQNQNKPVDVNGRTADQISAANSTGVNYAPLTDAEMTQVVDTVKKRKAANGGDYKDSTYGFYDMNAICSARGYDKKPTVLNSADFEKLWLANQKSNPLAYRTVGRSAVDNLRDQSEFYTGGVGQSVYGAGIYCALENTNSNSFSKMPPPPSTSNFSDSRGYGDVTHFIMFPKDFKWAKMDDIRTEMNAFMSGSGIPNPQFAKIKSDLAAVSQKKDDFYKTEKDNVFGKYGYHQDIDNHLGKYLDSESSISSFGTLLNKMGNGAKGSKNGAVFTLQMPNKADGSKGNTYTLNLSGKSGRSQDVINLYNQMRNDLTNPVNSDISNIKSHPTYTKLATEHQTLYDQIHQSPRNGYNAPVKATIAGKRSPEDQKLFDLLNDHRAGEKVGLYAAYKGYDGLLAYSQSKPGAGGYAVIYNRSKIIMSNKDY